MQDKLTSIFNAITPDNIKNISLISDSMEIFIELLNENSSISSDISIALSELTSDVLSKELPKIYLYDYYSMIENIKNSKIIVNKFRNWNAALNPSLYPIGIPYIGDKIFINFFTIGEDSAGLSLDNGSIDGFNNNPLSGKLNSLSDNLIQNKPENYFINRIFKQSKGLTKSITFLYNILNEHLVNINERIDIDIQETGNPFEFEITGSLDKDIYVESVAYLAHPLGFVYNYNYISDTLFDDNYSLSKYYNIGVLEVRSLFGVTDTYTKEVIFILDDLNSKKILFSDGYYLTQENQIVRYYDNNNSLVLLYPLADQYSIYVEYSIEYKSLYDDEFEITII